MKSCCTLKFTSANKIEVMYERLHVSVKVKTRSTSCLISTLNILPLLLFIYVIKIRMYHGCVHTGTFVLDYHALRLAALHVHRIEIPYRAFLERVGPRILLLERVDYFRTSDYFSGRNKQ